MFRAPGGTGGDNMTGPAAATATGSRKAQALAFICDFIVERGHSPAMIDIARGLKVSKQRARTLVDQLIVDGDVERLVGAQRAITVPGLARRAAIAQLRRDGFVVDEDVLAVSPATLPKDNLSLVAIIEHLPDHDDARQ